jgi:hypothetical protein
MSSTKLSKWDAKIQAAKALLAKVEQRAVRLREALVTFEAEKNAGKPATRK